MTCWSSPRRQGPIRRALSIGCGVWVPGLARKTRSPGTTKRLQLHPLPLVRGPVAGVVHLDGLVGKLQARVRRAPLRDALHEILDLLQVAARPFLFEANVLPAGL